MSELTREDRVLEAEAAAQIDRRESWFPVLAKRNSLGNAKERELFGEVGEACRQAVAKYDCLVGVAVYGSRVKGYAGPKSDLDVVFIFDSSRFNPAQFSFDTHGEVPNADIAKSKIRHELHTKLRNVMQSQVVQKENNEVVVDRRVSDEVVDLISSENMHARLQAREFMIQSAESPEAYADRIRPFWIIFLPVFGNKISAIRASVLRTLQEQGQAGERAFSVIMECLKRWENHPFSESVQDVRNKNLYPQTIDEAFKYYRLEGV